MAAVTCLTHMVHVNQFGGGGEKAVILDIDRSSSKSQSTPAGPEPKAGQWMSINAC